MVVSIDIPGFTHLEAFGAEVLKRGGGRPGDLRAHRPVGIAG